MRTAELHKGPTVSKIRQGVLSKRTLSTMSHALEMAATALGDDAVVIAAFERRTYFEPCAHAYERLVNHGVTVAVAYVGEQDTEGRGFQVPLQIDESVGDMTADTAYGTQVCQLRPFVFETADKALYESKNASR